MSNLLIVESPAKARTIKKYLGSNYKVVASNGHVRDLPKSRLGIDVDNGFSPDYIPIRGKGDLIKQLKKDAKAAKRVYLATDPDREGEAISWHLAQLLELDGTQPVRVTFNEINKQAVQQGVKTARPINMNLVDAQQARRVVDRLVGYKLSPFLWKSVRRGLSAGRVQSVATRLIVDREAEIEAFVPQEYWTLDAAFQSPSNALFTARFHGDKRGKIPLENKEDVDRILNAVEDAAYKVLGVKKSQRKRNPTPPFITSTLQQDASRKLGFSAAKTMSIAQELYEGVQVEGLGLVGIITYMRTDSLRISQEALAEVRSYITDTFGSEYCPKTPRFFRGRGGAQDAHEAIRPSFTDLNPAQAKGSLKRDHFRLYKLIWDRFVACQMEAQILDIVSVDIEASGKEKNYLFKASGSTVRFDGYTVVYIEASDEQTENDDDKEGQLPPLSADDVLVLDHYMSKQHFTQPPPRFTEATLIKTLEENGIGRPSTYAPTISTIVSREYVEREGKSFKPTQLGIVTTTLMVEHFRDIVDVEFTAQMEESLDHVENGEVIWQEAVNTFFQPFEQGVKRAESELGETHYKIPDEVTDEVCEQCGRNMVVKSGRFGRFLACPGYPECKNTKQLIQDTGAKCPVCGARIVRRKSRKKKNYYACEHNPTCPFITWYEPTQQKCSLCNTILLQQVRYGKRSLICANEDCPNGQKRTAQVDETDAEEDGGEDIR